MQDAGLPAPLRKRCRVIAAAGVGHFGFLDENVQKPIPPYISGLRCWAAFCDAVGVAIHFLAAEVVVLRYVALFASSGTLSTFSKQHAFIIHKQMGLQNLYNRTDLGILRSLES